jgi:hypothetical protein
MTTRTATKKTTAKPTSSKVTLDWRVPVAGAYGRSDYFTHATQWRKSDLTCPVCGFVPNRYSWEPRKAFGDHMRRKHPEVWAQRKEYFIDEEPW